MESWTIHLRAERKAEGTVRLYATGVRAFSPGATGRARQLALRRFAAWLTEEGELDADPLVGLKPPKLDTKVRHRRKSLVVMPWVVRA